MVFEAVEQAATAVLNFFEMMLCLVSILLYSMPSSWKLVWGPVLHFSVIFFLAIIAGAFRGDAPPPAALWLVWPVFVLYRLFCYLRAWRETFLFEHRCWLEEPKRQQVLLAELEAREQAEKAARKGNEEEQLIPDWHLFSDGQEHLKCTTPIRVFREPPGAEKVPLAEVVNHWVTPKKMRKIRAERMEKELRKKKEEERQQKKEAEARAVEEAARLRAAEEVEKAKRLEAMRAHWAQLMADEKKTVSLLWAAIAAAAEKVRQDALKSQQTRWLQLQAQMAEAVKSLWERFAAAPFPVVTTGTVPPPVDKGTTDQETPIAPSPAATPTAPSHKSEPAAALVPPVEVENDKSADYMVEIDPNSFAVFVELLTKDYLSGLTEEELEGLRNYYWSSVPRVIINNEKFELLFPKDPTLKPAKNVAPAG
ncbi:hypothetical protein HDU96_006857 [Phlyctochytrium bullatum]|nr:hypothetical protein HDU96_006857 [Phlyctochytrium bullatum]